MTSEIKKEAVAVKRIFDAQSKALVGWLYRWNTGEEVPRWIDGKCDDVIME